MAARMYFPRDSRETQLSYGDLVERSNQEDERRQRERQMMEEGVALWQSKKKDEIEQVYADQMEYRELSRSNRFGKPGNGAPTEDIRKKKFTEHQLDMMHHHLRRSTPDLTSSYSHMLNDYSGATLGEADPSPSIADYRFMAANRYGPDYSMRPSTTSSKLDMQEDTRLQDVLTFGRPGYGAPVRTRSGHLQTSLLGNPEIRFQNDKSVQKAITDTIRYQGNREDKASYQKALEEQIRERRALQKQERERDIALTRHLQQYEGLQWGRPGPGGVYWRQSALTGQRFFDNMGWCGSGDPRRRDADIKNLEAEDIKREISEHNEKKYMEMQDLKSEVGVELVPLIKQKMTGKPRKDPATGYMMSHSLSSTDVTKAPYFSSRMGNGDDSSSGMMYASNIELGTKKNYLDVLMDQVQAKLGHNIKRKIEEDEQQRRHFESWGTFWGRPGYGAPNLGKSAHRENLMKILHYPSQKCPEHVELITLERLPVK